MNFSKTNKRTINKSETNKNNGKYISFIIDMFSDSKKLYFT